MTFEDITMKTLHKNLIGLLGTATMMISTSTFALPVGWGDGVPAWSATASSCAIDESSKSKHEFTSSQFRFLGTNISDLGTVIGPIRLTLPVPITVRCNVTPVYDYVPAVPAPPGGLFGMPAYWKSSINWNALIVGYKDPDGTATNAQVTAVLRKVSRTTLTESTIATFNSNSFVDASNIENVKTFTPQVFDFHANEYYVEINLYRTDTTVATPVAYSVRLTSGSAMSVPQ
jgi:hypothetical protein